MGTLVGRGGDRPRSLSEEEFDEILYFRSSDDKVAGLVPERKTCCNGIRVCDIKST